MSPQSPPTAAKPQPQLLPELWGKVIAHLPRPMDSVGSLRTPNDYHQADLARVMRVSKLFYEIAAPVLYERVIMSDFPLFLAGVPQLFPNQAGNYHTSKTRLLSLVKRLDIAYTPLHTGTFQGPPIPPAVLAKLDLPAGVVPALTNDFNNAFTAVDDILTGWSMDPNAPLLFPNLKTVTIGAFGERLWDTYEPRFTLLARTSDEDFQFDNETNTPDQAFYEFKIKLGQIMQSRSFGRYLANTSNVDHVCSRVSVGPMTYIHNNHFPTNGMMVCNGPPPKSCTTHLLEQIQHGSWLCIVEGTTNRWIVHPAYMEATADVKLAAYSYFRNQLDVRLMLAPSLQYDPNTKIEIYGLLHPDMLMQDREAVISELRDYLTLGADVQAQVCLMEGEPEVCQACGELDS